MMVHIILLYTIFVAFVECCKKKDTIRIAFVILFLFAALRYGYGNDYFSYFKWYQYIQQGGKSPYDEEVLFTLLNIVMPSYQLLIVFTSAVLLGTTYSLIHTNLNSEYACLGLLIFVINPYLFLMNLSALRQSVAMSLFVIATQQGMSRKPLRFFALMIIACLFHKSAVVLLPTYFLMKPQKLNWKHILPVIAAVIIITGFVDLTKIINVFAGLFNDANYLNYANNGISNSLRATLLTGISFIYVVINLPKLQGKEQIYAKLYLIATILGIFAYQVAMFTRIQMYFDIFAVVSLPQLIQKNCESGPARYLAGDLWNGLKEISNKYILPVLVLSVYALRYYSFFTNPSWDAFFKYHTIFSIW